MNLYQFIREIFFPLLKKKKLSVYFHENKEIGVDDGISG